MKVLSHLWILGLLLALPRPGGAQPTKPATPPELNAKITAFPTSISPYEPVDASILLSNGSQHEVTFTTTGLRGIEFRPPDQNEWRIYIAAQTLGSAPYPVKRTFPSGFSESAFIPMSTQHDGQHVFASSGSYELKAWFSVENERIFSQPVTITVTKVPPDDAAAYQSLQQNGLYLYFIPDTTIYLIPTWDKDSKIENPFKIRQQLEAFAAQYPASRYADWARLAAQSVQLGLIKRSESIAEIILDKRWSKELVLRLGDEFVNQSLELHKEKAAATQRVQEQLDALATQVEKKNPKVAVFALQQAAIIAASIKDNDGALSRLNRALALDNTPANQQKVDYLKWVHHIAAPVPLTYAQQVLKQLKAENYDVTQILKELPQSRPKEYGQYVREIDHLVGDLLSCKTSDDEYQRKRAEILTFYIKRYGNTTAQSPN